ncbi:hypothetical protein [Fodinibius roseus]|uniref:hypothetical protein n=1 Tax=Fodinibius roseus TaxID=1194090 RepID=UPI003D9C8EE2
MSRTKEPGVQDTGYLISYQLSAISYQLSAISYQLSAISYQLSEAARFNSPCQGSSQEILHSRPASNF